MGKGFPNGVIAFFVIALLSLGLNSCTHITYQSDGLIPIWLTTQPDHRHDVVVEGVKEFYLWGRINPDNYVYIDEEFYNEGYLSIGSLEVQQYQTFGQFMSAFFSLGFYIPTSYRLTGKGAREGE